jgi:cytochrome P450
VTRTRPAFPASRPESCPLDPDAVYARLRAEEPVTSVSCPLGIDTWLVSRYEDIRAMLVDPRLSARAASSQHMLPDYDLSKPVLPGSIVHLDGEEHSRLRRLLIGEFTVRRMDALRPYVQQIADEHIDAMLAGGNSAELVRDFALAIPSLTICELLGVPYADRAEFDRNSQLLMTLEADRHARSAAFQRMSGYLCELVEDRLDDDEPRDDLLSRLITRAYESGDPLSMDELIMLTVTLLVAGHETTASMLGLSVVTLLENPGQVAALQADPGTAVEELLRYLTVIQFGLLREATEDVVVAGQEVKAGEWIVGAISSGNRDETVYTDPDTVDLSRPHRSHLAFGFGAHQCLGQHLARVELKVALTTLFRRIPGLRLARPLVEADFRRNDLVYGVWSLPVTW